MYCFTGSHMASIYPNGEVKGLICNHVKPHFNIFKKDIIQNTYFMKLVKCSLPSCGCGANDPILKFRDKDEAGNILKILKSNQEKLFKK